jgi:hypothetical protein
MPSLSDTSPLRPGIYLPLPFYHVSYLTNISTVVRFEVFPAVTMKNVVFWDVAPYRSCVSRCFGGLYRLHLQGRKIGELGTSVSRWLQPP